MASRHWSGTQSGWNARGGETTRETMARIREEAEISNPDSRYWYSAANAKLDDLRVILGAEYSLWAEIIWPDINSKTWKEIYETAVIYLDRPENVWGELECDCNGVTGPCRVCQAYARLTARAEAEAELV